MRFSWHILGGVTALLAAASLWDVTKRRIPNPLNVSVALFGLTACAATRGLRGFGEAVAAGAIVLALLWIPWTRGGLGGGDVKLAGALATWVGLSSLLDYLLVSAVAGGGLAIACLLASTSTARREIASNLARASRGRIPEVTLANGQGRVSVPYGVAFSVGALVCLWTGGLVR